MNLPDALMEDPRLPFGDQLRNADGFRVPKGYFENQLSWSCEIPSIVCAIDESESKGFQLPSGYFDQLTERIMERVQHEELLFLPKDEGLAIPNAYFESFPQKVVEHIVALKEKPKVKVISFRRILTYAVAACLLLAVSITAIRFYQTAAETDVFASCSDDDMLEYLSYYSNDLDDQSLAVLLNEEDLPDLDFINGEDEDLESLLIDYLE